MCLAHIVRDLLAQFGQPHRRAVAQLRGRRRAPVLRRDLGELLERQLVERGHGRAEVERGIALGRQRQLGHRLRTPRDVPGRRRGDRRIRRRPGRRAALLGQHGGNVGARPDAAADIALGQQPFVDQDHGVARHAEFRGQLAGGRQPRVLGDPALHDGLADLLEHLRVQRIGPAAVQRERTPGRVVEVPRHTRSPCRPCRTGLRRPSNIRPGRPR
ncbi:hypothetical protein FQZ97_857910 [compost metagenome]